MKFGKTLQVRITPAQRGSAVDYKALKKSIALAVFRLRRGGSKRARLASDAGGGKGAPSGSASASLPSASPGSKRARAPVETTVVENAPAGGFVATPAQGAGDRLGGKLVPNAVVIYPGLREEFVSQARLELLKASAWYLSAARTLHTKAQTLGREAAEVMATIEAEGSLGPTSAAAAAAAAAAAEAAASAAPSAEGAALAVPSKLRARVTELQTSALDLADDIADLRDFSLLNTVAMDKIGKKWDKHVHKPVAAKLASTKPRGAAARHADDAEVPIPTRTELNDLATSSDLSDAGLLDAVQAEVDGVLRTYAAPKRKRPQVPAVETAIRTVQRLDIGSLPEGRVSRLYIALGTDPLCLPLAVPVMVARGKRAGPTLGLTSALHGNELNGMPLIHRLFEELDCDDLAGTVVAVIVANPHGYVRHQRGGPDNTDLNRVMPGKKDGTASQQFAYALLKRVVAAANMDFLLDLHTASFGRVNSLYVRADLTDPQVMRLALLQHPQIIVHNRGKDGTLRGAASDLGIHTLTVEIGNPQKFHRPFIERALAGVYRTMRHLRMLPPIDDEILERVSRYTFAAGDKRMSLVTSRPAAFHRASPATEASAAVPAASSSVSASSLDATAAAATGNDVQRRGTMQTAAAAGASVVTDHGAADKGLLTNPSAFLGDLGQPSTAGIMAASHLASQAAPARVAAAVGPKGIVNGLPGEAVGASAASASGYGSSSMAPHAALMSATLRAAPASDASSSSTTTTSSSSTYAGAGAMAASHAPGVVRSMPSLSPGHALTADPGAWRDPVICSSSHWIFTRTGGILYVVPPVYSWVRKGDILADVRSVFGHCVQRYFAPCDGIVVGKSDNPVCRNGDRILHLGVVGGDLEDATDDGHP